MRVALFGGSFNPPHVGHLLAATYVRAVAEVDELWLLPVHRHPFGKALAPFEARVALCRALCDGVQGLSVSTVESELDGKGYTLNTVRHLQGAFPGHSFRLVIGADILADTPKWFGFDELVRRAPLIVLGRGGYDRPVADQATVLDEVPMPAVSSTEVRRRLSLGDDVSQLVPSRVLAEIRARRLYGVAGGESAEDASRR